ncbi:hypothetical protein [Nostoc sp. JL33]|nr:hypothetical protein [Nostoc sp. JL33]MBN3874705.1 hypothetical protein [Nostoc sp. JL33]
MAYPPFPVAIANVIDCRMFTNTPDSIMVGLPDFLLAPVGGFSTQTNSV